MERSLLKRPHLWSICITPRALWEDEHTLPLLPHLRGRLIKRRVRRSRVGAIDKDGTGEGHEPAKKGHEAKRALGRDAAVRGEDGAEEEDVEFGLVVPDQHARPRVEVFLARDDFKVHARRPGHGVVEGSGDGPLADAVLADEAEGEGCEDTIGGAEDEAAVGGEYTGVEGSGWEDGEVGEGEEGGGEAEVEGEEAEKDEDDGVHDGSCREREGECGEEIWLRGSVGGGFVRCGRGGFSRTVLTRGSWSLRVSLVEYKEGGF